MDTLFTPRLLGLLLLLGLVASFSLYVHTRDAGVIVDVYFNPNASEEQIATFGGVVEKQSSVKKLEYVTQEQAYAEFKMRNEGDAKATEALEKLENVFGARLTITLGELNQKEELVAFIEANDPGSIIEEIAFR